MEQANPLHYVGSLHGRAHAVHLRTIGALTCEKRGDVRERLGDDSAAMEVTNDVLWEERQEELHVPGVGERDEQHEGANQEPYRRSTEEARDDPSLAERFPQAKLQRPYLVGQLRLAGSSQACLAHDGQ